MRINKYVAQATGLSRRNVDEAILQGRVMVNDAVATLGYVVQNGDHVSFDDKEIYPQEQPTTIILNKPVGYVCSRDGQGSKTVYDLLPDELYNLKPVGRLDKDSSGLLLLTNDGDLAYQLTHPSFVKEKVYQVVLDRILKPNDLQGIKKGIELNDGLSKLKLDGTGTQWTVTMHEGRNRQIRRTFEALGYSVVHLHRTTFGDYSLDQLASGQYQTA